jgi:hypothetical protein
MSFFGMLSCLIPRFYGFTEQINPKITQEHRSKADHAQGTLTRIQDTPQATRNLFDLPPETLLNIMRFLSAQEKTDFKRVSHKGHEIASAALWEPSWIRAQLFANHTEVTRFTRLRHEKKPASTALRKIYQAISNGNIRSCRLLTVLDMLHQKKEERQIEGLVSAGLIKQAALDQAQLTPAKRQYVCSDPVILALQDLATLPDTLVENLPDTYGQIGLKRAFLELREQQSAQEALSSSQDIDNIEAHYYALKKAILQNPWFMQIDTLGWYVPLRSAIEENDVYFMAIALSYEADISYKSQNGSSLLALAAHRGRIEIAQLLLNHRADPSEVNVEGDSPLHLAAYQGHSEISYALLKAYSKNVNQANYAQFTPLHLAALSGCCLTIKTLLAYGADIKHLDSKKRSAYDLAKIAGKQQAMHLLQSNGAEAAIASYPESSKINPRRRHVVSQERRSPEISRRLPSLAHAIPAKQIMALATLV